MSKFITSEREMEDYICDNIDSFIDFLKENLYSEEEKIEFVGRQVHIGKENIADLVFFTKYEEGEMYKNYNEAIIHNTFIIVELKFRELDVPDLSQLQRYMNVLSEKIKSLKSDKRRIANGILEIERNVFDCKGIFVSLGKTNKMQAIANSGNIKDIDYINFKPIFEFSFDYDTYDSEYISNLKLDKRIEKILALNK